MPKPWAPEHFSRRHYTAEDPAFDSARRIEVTVKVDGRQYAQLEMREPGLLAIVSKPDAPGIDFEIVEAVGKRYIDPHTPNGEQVDQTITPWQKAALGLP